MTVGWGGGKRCLSSLTRDSEAATGPKVVIEQQHVHDHRLDLPDLGRYTHVFGASLMPRFDCPG